MSYLGQLAGQNIICLGSVSEPDDFPPGLFTEEEISSMLPSREALDTDIQNLARLTKNHNVSVWRAASVYVHRLPHCRSNRDKYIQSLERKIEVLHAHSAPLRRFWPIDQAWVLRNLTTKQFVRSEEIALRADFIEGPIIRGVGFGHVVLMRICWTQSSDVVISSGSGWNVNRGVWAGHCFDITTLDKHQRATKNGAWEDVSEEVCKEIAEIWGNRYGFDWHRELVKKVVACRVEEQKTAEAARKEMVERLKESTRGSLSGAFTK
jgi:hypothetical protein